MTVSITPGYDHAADAIPTRATLRKYAEGLDVNNLPASLFSFSTNFASVTTTTVASNAEGSVWVDAQGNAWIQNRWGKVKFRRYEGGLETNRFLLYRQGAPVGPGHIWSIAYNSTFGQVVYQAPVGSLQAPMHGVNQATIESQATDTPFHYRFVIVGPTVLDIGSGAGALSKERYLIGGRTSGDLTAPTLTSFDSVGAIANFGHCSEMAVQTESTTVSLFRGYFIAGGRNFRKVV